MTGISTTSNRRDVGVRRDNADKRMLTDERPVERFARSLAQGRLELPRCAICEALIWYPRARCPQCMSEDLRWEILSGNGTLYSYTVNRRAQGKYRDLGPFVIAYIELDEGPRVMGHIVGRALDPIRIGKRVRLVSPSADEEVHLRFAWL